MPRGRRRGRSLVEWMAGRGAKVTAADIDTRFIDHLGSDSITVRRIDIRTDELPQAEFDLVHSRLVLEHLSDRRQILDRLVATLRPGGWMVIEDYDWTCYGLEGENPGFSDIADAMLGYMAKAGFERDYGRRVVGDLEAAGLTDVRGEGRARMIDGTSPGFDFFRLTFESLRGAVVDAGLLIGGAGRSRVGRIRRDGRLLTPLMMAGIGRRAF